MKPTTGNAPPRRLAKPKKQVRLDLRRRATKPEPEGDIEIEKQNSFWKFVGIVALLHVVVIVAMCWYYEMSPPPPPQEQMISLLPLGDVVKGTPGTQTAPKIGPTTPAPTVQHHPAPPPPMPVPTPVAVKPAPPVPTPTPQPIVKSDAPALIPVKPTPPAPPKPKVKVDLTLQDGPTPEPVKHVTKPKPHVKKPAPVATDDTDAADSDSPSNPDSQGLSKEQIAERLGDKLQSSGATNATNHGPSGSKKSQANQFADFYMSVRDQVMSKWTSPNLSVETAVTPQVTIRVESDGVTVLPESVTLTRSSGNQAYDDSALAAAKHLGHLVQPLPSGCPPVIYIDFTLN
jgi:outer membrane biosynthesis protein TonB